MFYYLNFKEILISIYVNWKTDNGNKFYVKQGNNKSTNFFLLFRLKEASNFNSESFCLML